MNLKSTIALRDPTFTTSRIPTIFLIEVNAARSICRASHQSTHPIRRPVKSAPRAEPAVDPRIWEHHEYSNILAHTQCLSTADGLWICSACKAENYLVHVQGPYPFQYIVCRSCEHIFCNDCISSDLLDLHPALQPAQTHIGHICTTCGLTHRAKKASSKTSVMPTIHHVKCVCGTRANTSWIPFAIGCPDAYRFDPNACAVHLKTALINRMYERRYDLADAEVQTREPLAMCHSPRPSHSAPQSQYAGSVRRPLPQTYATLSGPWNPGVCGDTGASVSTQMCATLPEPWSPDAY